MVYEPYTGRVRVCQNCGGIIGFVRNRNGRWFPVDIVGHPRDPDGDYYRTGMGNHGNFTPWHKCDPWNMVVENSASLKGLTRTMYQAYNEVIRDTVGVPDEVKNRVMTFYHSPDTVMERFLARNLQGVTWMLRLTEADFRDLDPEHELFG